MKKGLTELLVNELFIWHGKYCKSQKIAKRTSFVLFWTRKDAN